MRVLHIGSGANDAVTNFFKNHKSSTDLLFVFHDCPTFIQETTKKYRKEVNSKNLVLNKWTVADFLLLKQSFDRICANYILTNPTYLRPDNWCKFFENVGALLKGGGCFELVDSFEYGEEKPLGHFLEQKGYSVEQNPENSKIRNTIRLTANKPLRILEIGPGSGGMNLLYLLKDHPDSHIYALEPSRYNIRELKNKFSELKLKNLFFVKGKVDRLSKFPGCFFSMVEAHYVFSDPEFGMGTTEPFPGLFMGTPHKELLSAIQTTLGQIDRILEPGGRLRVSDYFKYKNSNWGRIKEGIVTFLEKKGYALTFSTDYFSEVSLTFSETRWHEMIIATKPNK